MRYFRLFQNLYIPGLWYLDTPIDGDGKEIGTWVFTDGQVVSVKGPLRVAIYRSGKPLDFTLADACNVPVVHPRVASVLKAIAPGDIQTFPIQVEGQPEPYILVNVIRLLKCIDEQASEHVEVWVPEDEDDQPERAGQYRNVEGMRIDKSRMGDAKIFRAWGWTTPLIVSEDVKDALEGIGATGMEFTEV